MKTLTSKSKIIFLVAVVAMLALVFCACSNGVVKIDKTGYPNKPAENAKISDKYNAISQEIANEAVQEYMNLIKIPHPSNHEDALRAYLVNWAKTNGFTPVEGPGGCMYFDVPATSGCENIPNIILQTHMDMVVATDDSLGEVDPQSVSVDIVKDEDTGMVHARDFKTNCGADDGHGIGISLAIAKNKKLSHGPLRLLFTTTEEIGCQGSKFVPAEFLNADYLLNIDGNRIGEVDISSAGYMNADYYKNMQEANPNANEKLISIKISDLAGGHSGMDITKPRRSAVSVITDMLNEVSQIDPSFQISSIECGTAYNAIATMGELYIYVDASKTSEVVDKVNSMADDIKNNYKDEKDVKVDAKVIEASANAISNADSKFLLSALKEIPNGLIKMSDIQADTAESSANIGIVNLKNGSLHISVSARSNNAEYMNTLMSNYEKIKNTYNLEYKLIEDSVVPVWETDGNNALSKLYLKGLREECGLEGYESILHGAVEPARFVDKHPGMLAICIGCDVRDEHTVTEAWYTKSTPVCVAAVLNVLDNITTLK